MALSRVKTWNAAETLTASDLNAEFNNVCNHFGSLDNDDINSTATYTMGELIVGSGITSADGGQLHVHTATAGTIQASADADEAVFENSGASGVTILSGATSTGNIAFGDSGDADNGLLKYTHGATPTLGITVNATAVQSIAAAATTLAHDLAIYQDTNNADSQIALGTSATEALFVEALNGGSNKTLEELRFTTKTASGTANHGKMSWYVDEVNIGNINDAGITLESGMVFTGNVTGNASGTAATVTGGTQAAITSCANLVTTGTIGTGVWQGTAVALAYGGTGLVGATDGKIVIADGSGAPVLLDVGSSTAITVLGTVATGTWQGTAVASAYLDADTAHLGVVQTFTGAKTFTANVTGGVDGTGVDLKLFGDSPGAYLEWDQSEDQLRIMGASADATTSTGKLLLATSLVDINANDVLGKIDFQAPHEAGGTDAITVAASIQAIAQGTFSASVNATDLIFSTGSSGAASEKFRFTSDGELGVGGANYGSDGQVLTSTGSGTAPAWESVSAGVSLSGSTNNTVATVTGANALIGEANLTFDGSVLAVTGAVTMANAAGPTIVNEAATATNPTLIPNKAEVDTGYGWAAADTLTVITGGTERMRIGSNGNVSMGMTTTNYGLGIETAEGNGALRAASTSAAAGPIQAVNTHAATTANLTFMGTERAANTLFKYGYWFSGGGTDYEFLFGGTGIGYSDGGWTTPAADYAEYFESTDGSDIPRGTTVVLDGDRVRAYVAEDSLDSIIGVVRPEEDGVGSGIVGNSAWSRWHGKYLKDDYGVYIREDNTVWEWDKIDAVEASEGVDAVEGRESGSCYEWKELLKDPSWTAPSGAVSNLQSERKINPEYTGSRLEADDDYTSREDRGEWNLIGLIGQVPVAANEPTNPRWIKMKDISDAVELWMIR